MMMVVVDGVTICQVSVPLLMLLPAAAVWSLVSYVL